MDPKHDFQPVLAKHNHNLPQSFSAPSQKSDEEQLDMGWLFAVMRRRSLAMVFIIAALVGSFGGLIVWSARRTPPIYIGAFRVLVEPITAEGQLDRLALNNEALAGSTSIQNVQVTKDRLDYESLIRVLQSPKLMNSVVEQAQAKYPDLSYGVIMQNLEIRRIMVEAKPAPIGTKILEIRYQDLNPNKVVFLLDKLAQTYLKYSRQERLTSLRQGIKFIEAQIPNLQQRVDKIQEDLQQLREQYNVMDPELAEPNLAGQAKLIQQERLSLEGQLVEKKQHLANLQRQLREENATAVLGEQGGNYSILIQQLQSVESKMAADSSLLREDSPPLRTLSRQKQNMRRLLLQKALGVVQDADSAIQGLQKRYQILLEAESLINQKIRQLPEAARRYSDLQRELKVVTDSLNESLTKREALNLSAAQQEVPWELIAPPGQPIAASNNQTTRKLGLVIVLSTLLGIAAGFLIEILIAVFHTPDDVKVATRLPLLGVIPFAKELRKRARANKRLSSVVAVGGLPQSARTELVLGETANAQQYSASPVVEAFRSLYTNIRLLSYEKPIQSLVIGSAEPGDGKSTVAVQLAQTAAAIGQRVLLVDGDLRCPKIHKKFDLPNVRGLSDTISSDLSLNDAIQRSPLEDNLFVLTAGMIPNDPIKLLSSKKMHSLMEQFQDFFDLVIYDTPPLVGLADSSIIAAQTDGIVLVVGLAKTDRSRVTKALEGLKIGGASVLGVVANGIKGYTPK